VTALIERYKKPDRCRDFANMRNYNWHILQVPLLFFYIIAVAESAEITVKCRSISSKFKDPKVITLFTFFEIEVFAFAGIIFGLFIWLSVKFILNSIYTSGPQYKFKTSGVKMAHDTLVRNHDDAFIFTGIFWTLICNTYLLSDLNVSYEVMIKT